MSKKATFDSSTSPFVALPTRKLLFRRLADPLWLDRRFWLALLLVAGISSIHIGLSLSFGERMTTFPNFVWILPILAPIAYAGLVFGLIGSLSITFAAIIAIVPGELLISHTASELWGAGSICAIAIVIAIMVSCDLGRSRSTTDPATTVEVLPEEEQRFRIAFEDTMVAMAVVGLDGHLLRVNRSLSTMLGYSPNELIGTNFLDYTHPDDRQLTLAMNNELAIGKADQLSYVKRLIDRSGRTITAEVSRSLAKDNRGVTIYIVASLRDLTAERTAETRIVESEQRFRLAFEDNMAGMVLHDRQGNFVDANEAFCTMVGYSVKELSEHTTAPFLHPDDNELATPQHRRLLSGQASSSRIVTRYLHKNGDVIHVEVARSVARDEHGEPIFFVSSVRDITGERSLTEQLSHQATHDSLTGLPNRQFLKDRVTQAHDKLELSGGYNALLLLDIDDFKGVNDTFGHYTGDQLLVGLARRLEAVTRASDTLSRFAGDEFVYLAEGLASSADAEALARRLLSVLDTPFVLDQSTIQRSATVGTVVWDIRSDKGYDELIQAADTAMYEAKRQGKARNVLYTPDMSERASNSFKLAQELGLAVTNNELAMHYQPLVELSSGRIVGFESLMRWHHPTLGTVSPEIFIPLAEQNNLILKLDSFAMNRASTVAASWEAGTPDRAPPYVTINLSARHFHDPTLLPLLEQTLATTNLVPERLVLEITESVALQDIDSAIRVINHIKHLGMTLALDDFGTGYSSLSYLAKLEPNVIKIDRSFVSPASKSNYAQRSVEAIVSLCRVLGITVLAEGIETSVQLKELLHLGCDLGQGFLFSHAIPADQIQPAEALVLKNWQEAAEPSLR